MDEQIRQIAERLRGLRELSDRIMGYFNGFK